MQPKEPPFLEKISRQGYSLNLGDFVNQAGKLVKDNLGIFVAYSATYGLILLIMNLLSFVGLLAELLIAPSLSIGFAIAAHEARQGNRPDFSDFFKGFSRFFDLFLANLLMLLGALVCLLPLGFVLLLDSAGRGFDSDILAIFGLFAILGCVVLVVALSVLFVLAPHYVYFYNMPAVEALRTSFEVVKISFGSWLGFLIVVGLLMFAGAFLCGLGLLFTYPLGMAAIYVAFANINDLEQNKGAELEQHLVG